MARDIEATEDDDILFYEGKKVKAFAFNVGKSCPVVEFFEGLEPRDQAGVTAVLERLDIQGGTLNNAQKFKKLYTYKSKPLLEIKFRQVRIGCFWEPGFNLYLAHGFIKKRGDWSKKDKENLQDAYDYYEQRRKKNEKNKEQ